MVGNITLNLFWTVADILQHVYLVRYLTLIVAGISWGSVHIISMYDVIFPGRNFFCSYS